MELASLLAAASMPSDLYSARHGATTTLPPAPWDSELFAQVREDTARAYKRETRSSDREAVYERAVYIFKDRAAERYAHSLDALRRSREGRRAYRKRVFAASADARRYWGYDEATSDGEGEQVAEGDCSQATGVHRNRDHPLGARVLARAAESGSTLKTVDGGASEGTHHQTSSLTSDHPDGCTRGLGAVGKGRTRSSNASTISGGVGEPRGGTRSARAFSGSSDGLIDVVPFNNIRAKYLRAWWDTSLSRPFNVPCVVNPVADPPRR